MTKLSVHRVLGIVYHAGDWRFYNNGNSCSENLISQISKKLYLLPVKGNGYLPLFAPQLYLPDKNRCFLRTGDMLYRHTTDERKTFSGQLIFAQPFQYFVQYDKLALKDLEKQPFMKRPVTITSLILITMYMLLPFTAMTQSNIISADNGKVSFLSEAPLELIRAASDKLKGAIDKSQGTFAFSVDIQTFRGFNGDLQREHFHENYMETEKFKTASFAGKFIEQVDFNTNGNYVVRAKGMFTIHGIQKERIIKGVIVVNNGEISIDAVFTVRLEDHDIKVPKIVHEKIAEEIRVEMSVKFKKQG